MNSLTNQENGNRCAKRLWVILTLSDDEVTGAESEMPFTLRAHLQHCDACRTVAAQLNRTNATLATLGDARQENPDFNVLFSTAQARVHEAVAEGLRLSGRVTIAEEPEEMQPIRSPRAGWSGQRLAIAASILLVIGLIGYAFQNGSRHPSASSNTAKRQLPTVVQMEPQPSDESNGDSTQATSWNGIALYGSFSQAATRGPSGKGSGSAPPHYHRFTSFEDALKDENPHGAQHAVILPDRSRRNMGLLKLFDKPASLLSTKEDRSKE